MTSESKSVQKRVAIQQEARAAKPPPTAKKRVFRFYEDEYLAWQQRAKRQKVSLTEWIRQACRQQLG